MCRAMSERTYTEAQIAEGLRAWFAPMFALDPDNSNSFLYLPGMIVSIRIAAGYEADDAAIPEELGQLHLFGDDA